MDDGKLKHVEPWRDPMPSLMNDNCMTADDARQYMDDNASIDLSIFASISDEAAEIPTVWSSFWTTISTEATLLLYPAVLSGWNAR